jgi:hypothetical protein
MILLLCFREIMEVLFLNDKAFKAPEVGERAFFGA